MTNLGILDLILGLSFIYFILSVICTSIVEVFAQLRNMRAESLNRWIKDAFNTKDGGTLGSDIISHKLVDGLTMNGRIASFIPPKIFSSVLLDLIQQEYLKALNTPDPIQPFTCDTIQNALRSDKIKLPADLKRYMLQSIEDCHDAQKSLNLLTQRIENWYQDAMDRLTGTYKKKTRWITIVVATIITISLNINTVTISKYLKDNPQKMEALAIAAEKATKDSVLYKQTLVRLDSISSKFDSSKTASSVNETIALIIANKQQSDSLYNSLAEVGLPIGWSSAKIVKCDTSNTPRTSMILCYIKSILTTIAGWIATIAALTLGAPFWFDLINKVVNIKSVGRTPASTKNN